MLLEILMKLCMAGQFLEKVFLLQKLEKWAKNTPKIGFSEFKEKIGHEFPQNLFKIVKKLKIN